MIKGAAMIGKILRWINKILLAVASTALAVMMFLMAADVAGRYIFNRPISGALEVIEYLMAVLVSFAIAYCAYQKAHVSVDLVMERFSRRVQRVMEILMALPAIFFLGLMSWQSVLYMVEKYESGMTSSVLLIPVWPFLIPLSIGTAVFVLNLIARIFRIETEAPNS